MKPPRPILFDVHLDASPPAYELLFLAELDSDHRTVLVPFQEVPALQAEAFAHASSELTSLAEEDIARLRSKSMLIDRAMIQ